MASLDDMTSVQLNDWMESKMRERGWCPPAEIERLREKLDKIAKHPSTPELVRQYALGMLDGSIEQSEPPLVHAGRNGDPHHGPRAACTICFMWDQIANEQHGDGRD